ncbi:MAG: PEP-CTERM sorting domain-containing protein [Rubrivivax sp.]|nr:PEP-CTERM sorting domain-containing protein [Rubrivivax sp.]
MIKIPLAATGLALALGAAAEPQQSDVTPPGGFVATCAAETSGTNYLAYGGHLAANWSHPAYNGKYACDAQMFSGAAGSAQAIASHSAPKIASSSAGHGSMGLLQLEATNASPANTYFAQGAANGGWSDTTTVTVDGLAGSAVWLINVGVTGSASVVGGSAAFAATAYKNETELNRAVAGFDKGDSDSFTTDRQKVRWRVSAANNTEVLSRTVDDVVTFAVPVTLGTSFVWGVYGSAFAGQRAATTGDGRIETAQLDPFTMRFLGTAGVLAGGQLYSNVQLSSPSGIDWLVATPVPEPATWAMMLTGIAWLVRRRLT